MFPSRFQKHVHTYRILPDDEGFLAVQVQQWPTLFLIMLQQQLAGRDASVDSERSVSNVHMHTHT